MAYSMFECPKLQNARSLKLYEEYDHRISLRHKNLPPDFELTDYPKSPEEPIQPQNSSHKKCPIYVHHFNDKIRYDGDFVPKKSKNKQKAVLEKLEETYWANWKPDRNGKKSNISTPPMTLSKSPEIHVIKSAPRRRKIRMYPKEEETLIEKIEKVKKSQEIQTDFEEVKETPKEEAPVEEKIEEIPPVVEEDEENKFLKHTDSFILNSKKQKEQKEVKENFEQPKCIRLYRKAAKNSSRNVVRGGSYPLKSCLKKDSNFSKTSSKLQRPGSPIISNFSSKKFNKAHRH